MNSKAYGGPELSRSICVAKIMLKFILLEFVFGIGWG